MIEAKDVIRTYSGKPGCMCGCQGKYNENPKSFKAALTRMLKTDYKVDFWDGSDDDGGCLYFQTESRNNVIYFKKGALTPDMVPADKITS